jgi:hypothetical protein
MPAQKKRRVAKSPPIKKTSTWIFDSSGTVRHGWLEIVEDEVGGTRPADKGWHLVAAFPVVARREDLARVVLWADGVDKYIARIAIADAYRWVIMEGLPALLANIQSFNALIQMGRGQGAGE